MAEQKGRHFVQAEMACHCCGGLPPGGVPEDFIEKMDALRDAYGAPILVNSWYRCPANNARVGGSERHPSGRAVDCRVSNPARLIACAVDLGFRGIGVYPSFIHLDDFKKGWWVKP